MLRGATSTDLGFGVTYGIPTASASSYSNQGPAHFELSSNPMTGSSNMQLHAFEFDPHHPKPESIHQDKQWPSSSTANFNNSSSIGSLIKDVVGQSVEDGAQTRKLGVVFRDLRVVGLGVGAAVQQNLISLLYPQSIIKYINTLRHPSVHNIISDFEGVVLPGEMLLVLGRPGAGCSTFLKTLANHRGDYYDFSSEEIEKRYRGDVVYCPEDDVHFPTLNVGETLEFASTMRTPTRGSDNQSRSTHTAEALMRIFGLEHAENTVVGDASLRGISGGEKKRVSLAEVMSMRGQLVCWDNSTRGLDSSTALEFIRALRIATDAAKVTTVVCIYQAGEQFFNLFDKERWRTMDLRKRQNGVSRIWGMYRTIGKRRQISWWRQPIPKGGRPVLDSRAPYPARRMRWLPISGQYGQRNRTSIDSYYNLYVDKPDLKVAYDASAMSEHAGHARRRRGDAPPMANTEGRLGDAGCASGIFQGIFIGSVFLQLARNTSAYYSRDALFFLYGYLVNIAEMPSLFPQRLIVLRHQKGALYYPFIEGFAHLIVEIPINFISVAPLPRRAHLWSRLPVCLGHRDVSSLLLLRKGGQTVYFGDIGERSMTMIDYFQRHGAPRCAPDANPAEYMLDVTGAGATATCTTDWHQVWKDCPEAAKLDLEIERIYQEGRSCPVVSIETHSEFASSWMQQLALLTHRGFVCNWRNPVYIYPKPVVCVAAGLVVGFTFFGATNSLWGCWDKLAREKLANIPWTQSVFVAIAICVPLAQQLQNKLIKSRTVYEVRERPARMYTWSAFLVSEMLIEIPWNMLGSSLVFFCWYWTSDFGSSRAGFSYLFYCVVYPLYYTTFALATVVISPNGVIASTLFSVLFSFMVIFLHPHIIALGDQMVACTSTELVTIEPPPGMSCSAYMDPYITFAGGYLADPTAIAARGFCPFRTTNAYMQSKFNVSYGLHWRDLGIILGVAGFNVLFMFAGMYFFRVRKGMGWPKWAGLKRAFARPSETVKRTPYWRPHPYWDQARTSSRPHLMVQAPGTSVPEGAFFSAQNSPSLCDLETGDMFGVDSVYSTSSVFTEEEGTSTPKSSNSFFSRPQDPDPDPRQSRDVIEAQYAALEKIRLMGTGSLQVKMIQVATHVDLEEALPKTPHGLGPRNSYSH
ncbi:hypothetical protein OG21DRAFT_1521099 [Imleria badia]|nr:hypothetical protein OG21DRAFT_1521099 [Imleria badia]